MGEVVMADVVVFGLDIETVPLDDIMMDVPHARTVTIPEDKAIRSKDLWRALSQKRIFKLSPDPNPHKFVPAAPPVPITPEKPTSDEMRRLSEVLSENVTLREEAARLRARITVLEVGFQEREKLDEILRLLRERPVS